MENFYDILLVSEMGNQNLLFIILQEMMKFYVKLINIYVYVNKVEVQFQLVCLWMV